MVAQLFPAIKAEPSNIIWGLPTVAWGILIGCSVLAVLSVATLFLCCWLIPRSRKFLSPTRCSSTRTQVTDRSGPRISVHSTDSAGECCLVCLSGQVEGRRSRRGSVQSDAMMALWSFNLNIKLLFSSSSQPQLGLPSRRYGASKSTRTRDNQWVEGDICLSFWKRISILNRFSCFNLTCRWFAKRFV